MEKQESSPSPIYQKRNLSGYELDQFVELLVQKFPKRRILKVNMARETLFYMFSVDGNTISIDMSDGFIWDYSKISRYLGNDMTVFIVRYLKLKMLGIEDES